QFRQVANYWCNVVDVFPAAQHIVSIEVDLAFIAVFRLQDFYLLDVQLQFLLFAIELLHQFTLLSLEPGSLSVECFPVSIALVDLGLQNIERVQLNSQSASTMGK